MDSLLKFISANPSSLVLVISTLIAWKSFKTQRFLTRAKNTIDFESSYHVSREIQDCEKRVRSEIRLKLTSEKIAQLAEPENFAAPFASDIREMLNVWERVAIAVKNEVYDEDILFMAYTVHL